MARPVLPLLSREPSIQISQSLFFYESTSDGGHSNDGDCLFQTQFGMTIDVHFLQVYNDLYPVGERSVDGRNDHRLHHVSKKDEWIVVEIGIFSDQYVPNTAEMETMAKKVTTKRLNMALKVAQSTTN